MPLPCLLHSDNDWSTEVTMKRYVEKILLPFLNEKRADLKLNRSHPALAIFDFLVDKLHLTSIPY